VLLEKGLQCCLVHGVVEFEHLVNSAVGEAKVQEFHYGGECRSWIFGVFASEIGRGNCGQYVDALNGICENIGWDPFVCVH
jgi:hypothetical protein